MAPTCDVFLRRDVGFNKRHTKFLRRSLRFGWSDKTGVQMLQQTATAFTFITLQAIERLTVKQYILQGMAELADLSDDENAASTTGEAEEMVDTHFRNLSLHHMEARYKLPSNDMCSPVAARADCQHIKLRGAKRSVLGPLVIFSGCFTTPLERTPKCWSD